VATPSRNSSGLPREYPGTPSNIAALAAQQARERPGDRHRRTYAVRPGTGTLREQADRDQLPTNPHARNASGVWWTRWWGAAGPATFRRRAVRAVRITRASTRSTMPAPAARVYVRGHSWTGRIREKIYDRVRGRLRLLLSRCCWTAGRQTRFPRQGRLVDLAEKACPPRTSASPGTEVDLNALETLTAVRAPLSGITATSTGSRVSNKYGIASFSQPL